MHNYYKYIAPFYDEITSKYFDYSKTISQLKKLVKGKDILEIGSGTGNVALCLAKEGLDVIGIETSEPMLTIAQSKNGEAKITFLHQDAESFSINKKFDSVILYESVICLIRSDKKLYVEVYLQDQEKTKQLIQRIFHHLKPEGNLIIGIKKERDTTMKLEFKPGYFYHVKTTFTSEHALEITHFIEENGKEIVREHLKKFILSWEEFTSLLQGLKLYWKLDSSNNYIVITT